jgi:hypothetical protein
MVPGIVRPHLAEALNPVKTKERKNNRMEKSNKFNRSGLRRFRDVTRHIRRRRPVSLKEARIATKPHNKETVPQIQEATDLNYLVVSVPNDVDYEEKLERISAVADTITSVEGSDVMLMALWVPTAG